MIENRETELLLRRGYDGAAAEGIASLSAAAGRDPALSGELDRLVGRYTSGEIPMDEAKRGIGELAARFGGNEYSLSLLFVLRGLPFMHDAFRRKGLPDGIFYDSMDDLRCKVGECLACRGVIGTFVLEWYDGFFKAERFAFGRFQYETARYEGETLSLSCGKTLTKGGRYLNFHIPSSGVPLTDEVRLASYRAAYPYFRPLFEDGVVLFGCRSWLLYPKHRDFLPATMNIRRFMDDFECLVGYETEDFPSKWRIFGKDADRPDGALPRDTTLRRAYADWLSSGGKAGSGFGLFAFDGDKRL